MLAAELRKLLTLPSVWIGAAVGLTMPAAITVIAARQAAQYGTPASADDGYQQLAIIGIVGAIIIGVVAVSSEFRTDDAEAGGGRPITTTLTVLPDRTRLLLAKLGATGTTVAVLAAITTAITLTIDNVVKGGPGFGLDTSDAARGAGVIVFWVLSAWIALGITMLTRSGILPLAVLIVNSSLVSVSYLLSKVVPAANYLPDLAGYSMFIRTRATTLDLDSVTGGLVMLGWTVAILLAGAVALHRRDA